MALSSYIHNYRLITLRKYGLFLVLIVTGCIVIFAYTQWESSYTGVYENTQGTITIQQHGRKIFFSGTAFSLQRDEQDAVYGANTGTLEGSATLHNNWARYVQKERFIGSEPPCSVDFIFSSGQVVVLPATESLVNCGWGLHVTFSGTYKKTEQHLPN